MDFTRVLGGVFYEFTRVLGECILWTLLGFQETHFMNFTRIPGETFMNFTRIFGKSHSE